VDYVDKFCLDCSVSNVIEIGQPFFSCCTLTDRLDKGNRCTVNALEINPVLSVSATVFLLLSHTSVIALNLNLMTLSISSLESCKVPLW
jgi:hypothetical protein